MTNKPNTGRLLNLVLAIVSRIALNTIAGQQHIEPELCRDMTAHASQQDTSVASKGKKQCVLFSRTHDCMSIKWSHICKRTLWKNTFNLNYGADSAPLRDAVTLTSDPSDLWTLLHMRHCINSSNQTSGTFWSVALYKAQTLVPTADPHSHYNTNEWPSPAHRHWTCFIIPACHNGPGFDSQHWQVWRKWYCIGHPRYHYI